MAGLNHQLSLVSLILISVTTFITAVPFDRQLSLNSNMYSPKNVSTSSENVCMIDDVLYQDGDAIPTASPCEKCVCRPPGFACSIITCEKRPNCRALQRSNQCCPEYKCDCEVEGKVYHNGEKLDNTLNPCKVCYCQGGEVACTVIECYKRDDCIPKHVPGMCCPKYDNCPPRDPARSASSSFSPPILPTNFTAAKEGHKFREVARDRLDLLGETEVTGQLLPENPINNNIYDLPQGDDPKVYVAYDDSDTSTSTTGFPIYDSFTSTTTPNYDSYEEASSSSSSTGESLPWTGFPTFPTDWPTQGPEWMDSTSVSTEGGSTESIPTWGTDYSTQTSSSTPNTSTSSTSEQSTATSTSSTTTATPSSYSTTSSTISSTDISSTSSTLQSVSTDSTSVSTMHTGSTPHITKHQHSASNSTTSSSDAASTSTSTSDVSKSSEDISTNSLPTTTTFSLEHSTVTLTDEISQSTSMNSVSSFSGSGDGEPDARTSNCIDGSENCDQHTIIDSDNDSYTSVTLDDNLYDVIQADGTTVTNDETGTEINDPDATEQNYSPAIITEGAAYADVKKLDVTTTEKDGFTTIEGSSETDSTEVMAADMAQSDQGQQEVNDFWNDDENKTTPRTSLVRAETKILPDVLNLKSNNTLESLKVDSNGTVEVNTDISIPQEWLKKAGDDPGDADGSNTLSDDSSVVTTDVNVPTSTEANGYEASTTLDYNNGSSSPSSHPATETTVTEDTAATSLASKTDTTGSSASETFSTTQTSETGSQSTGTWSDATTTQISS